MTPEIFLIWAQSSNGLIAENPKHLSFTWNSPADKKRFVALTTDAVIICGHSTFKTFPGGRPLKGRLNVVYTRDEKLLNTEPTDSLMYTNLDPATLMLKLQYEGHTRFAICGGSAIYSLFWNAGLVTKLYVTIEPVFFPDTPEAIRMDPDPRDDPKAKIVRRKKVNVAGTIFEDWYIDRK